VADGCPIGRGGQGAGIPHPRQREVAALVAAGLTDAEIAARLGLARREAFDEVEAILHRLAFRRRTQSALWAVACALHAPDDDGT